MFRTEHRAVEQASGERFPCELWSVVPFERVKRTLVPVADSGFARLEADTAKWPAILLENLPG